MLIGRKIGQYNQKVARPGNATGGLVITTYAPTIDVTGSALFLNHYDESDGATTLVDEVPTTTWTINANAEADTAQSKFGTASVLIPNGVNEWIEAEGWTSPASGLWTVEGWVRWDIAFSAGTNFTIRLERASDSQGAASAVMAGNGDFTISTDGNQGSGSQGANVGTINVNTWYHWAMVRESLTTFALFWNGTRITEQVWGGTQTTLAIERVVLQNNTDNSATVWFDECRLVDSAVYTTGTYSVPTGAFTL